MSLFLILFGVLIQVAQIVTPTVPPTIEGLNLQIQDLQATQQALQNAIPPVDIGENNFTYEGENLMPNVDDGVMRTLFGYIKWATEQGGESLFGAFAPVVAHAMVLIPLLFASRIADIAGQIIATTIKLGLWIAKWIARLIELIPFVQ